MFYLRTFLKKIPTDGPEPIPREVFLCRERDRELNCLSLVGCQDQWPIERLRDLQEARKPPSGTTPWLLEIEGTIFDSSPRYEPDVSDPRFGMDHYCLSCPDASLAGLFASRAEEGLKRGMRIIEGSKARRSVDP